MDAAVRRVSARLSAAVVIAAACYTAVAQAQPVFRNPLFDSQDPHIILWEGNYYYSDTYDGDRIRIRKSPTLTGLSKARPQVVWTATLRGWNGHANIWAPELHLINGRFYIYFSADYRTDRRHYLYVLEGGTDPMGPYTVPQTSGPNGMITESTGHWAIDPNVFTGPDANLYLTWSCTDDDVGTHPQNLCIARMSDPLHVSSSTVKVVTPVEPWETRGGHIAEGPVGFVRDGVTYITYSASASWTTNDYTVGLLVNYSGDLLNPDAWQKRGPILDRHGKAYGPGSVIFVSSRDGSEMWSMYHAYDRLDCRMWGCRSIRIQKMKWHTDGTPILGVPLDPGVPRYLPSGDADSPTGWGASRTGTPASGKWTPRDSASVEIAAAEGQSRIFRGDIDSISYTVSVRAQELPGTRGRYGIYALYYDDENYIAALIDSARRRFVTRASVGGRELPEQSTPLPAAFDRAAAHLIEVAKSTDRQFTFSIDGLVLQQRSVPLEHGQIGMVTEDTGARFREVGVVDTSHGWGHAFGDAAQGMSRGDAAGTGDGYVQGTWLLDGTEAALSLARGPGWHTLYHATPVYHRYTVEVEAKSNEPDSPARYGLIVCHADRNNQSSVWIDMEAEVLELRTTVGGESRRRQVPLPAEFDPAKFHRLKAVKSEGRFTFYLDGTEVLREQLPFASGNPGVASEDTRAAFRNFTFVYGTR